MSKTASTYLHYSHKSLQTASLQLTLNTISLGERCLKHSG